MNVNFSNRPLYRILAFTIIFLFVFGCKEPLSPRPRSFFRIDFPEKEYQTFTSSCKFKFEYPKYGSVSSVDLSTAGPCWYNLEFKEYKATIHLTYKPLNNNLSVHSEDVRRIVYKHIVKADDIVDSRINSPEREVYGMLYDIKGNAASSLNFYITDSLSGFLSGSLYFNVSPNRDSLSPAIQFFREDIVHLINTFSWE